MRIMPVPQFRIDPATPPDVPMILDLIRQIADYEKLSHEVIATEASLDAVLFGPHPAAEVLLGRVGDEVVGYAIFFHNFSTFLGRRGLYLEDLFVRPEWRRHGFGRALLARLARIAVERDCGRMEWSVLDWNAPSIAFYKSLGAKPMDEWTVFRMTDEAIGTLAAQSRA